MSNPLPLPAARPETVAEVRAREHVIRYRRAGAGSPVLLLIDGAERVSPTWMELIDALATRFRVIIPELDAPLPHNAVWLASFLEGLGAVAVDVVADDPFWLPAVQLALGEDELVARLVVVVHDSDDDEPLTSALAAGARSTAIPLILVSNKLPPTDLVDAVTRFLGEGVAPPQVEEG
jgi:hypothetical protein